MKKFPHLIEPSQYFVVLFGILLILSGSAWAATPTTSAVSASTSEDVNYKSITLSGSDTDSGDTLTYSYTQGGNGRVYQTSSNVGKKYVRYTPNTNWNGVDTFTYYVTDTAGNISNTSTVTVTVSAVNDSPTATTTTASLIEDTITDVALSGTDIENDPLTCSLYSNVNCTVVIDAATCVATVTPELDYTGEQMYFAYSVYDGDKSSSNTRVTITVTAVNDPPVAIDSEEVTDEDEDVLIVLPWSDPDSSPAAATIITNPTHGTLEPYTSSSGSDWFNYTPNENFNGTDEFTFSFTDSDGGLESNVARMSITVNPVNDAQTATDMAVETYQNTPVTITLAGEDADGDTLVYDLNLSEGYPSHGTVSAIVGDQVEYTPDVDYLGADTFEYSVSDGVTSYKAYATVSITVVEGPDGPIAPEGGYVPVAEDARISTLEDTAIVITLSATDNDSTGLTFSASSPTHGTFLLEGNTGTYTPEANFAGEDSFTFTASDGTHDSNTATVRITVRAVNDPPVVEDREIVTDEDVAADFTLTATDSDNDDFHMFDVFSCDHGVVTVDFDGNAVYAAEAGFDGMATCSYQALDGQSASNTAVLRVTINRTVDNPPTAQDLSITLWEDQQTVITLDAPDPEGGDVDYSIVLNPGHGTVEALETGVRYIPDADYYGIDTFTYQLNDGSVSSDTATVSLTIKAGVDPSMDCTGTVDGSHLQTDSSTGLEYYDNVIWVTTNRMATASEIRFMQNRVSGISTLCKIEQPEFTTDEIEALGEGFTGPTTGYGYYVFEVPIQNSFSDAHRFAQLLKSFAFVDTASVYFLTEIELTSGKTDDERLNNGSTDPNFFIPIYLAGAWEYLRAFQSQGFHLAQINMALYDTGVCASPEYFEACYSYYAHPDVPMEFEGYTYGDPDNFDGLNLVETPEDPADQPPGLPIGEVDKIGHGTMMAFLMAGKSNNNSPTIGYENDPVMNIGNGILGGVWGLIGQYKLDLTSYADADGYRFEPPAFDMNQPMYNAFFASCGKDVLNLSVIEPQTGWGPFGNLATVRTKLLTLGCPTFYPQGAGNHGIDLSAPFTADPPYYASPFSPRIFVGATEYGSRTDLYVDPNPPSPEKVGSNSGGPIEIFASGRWTSNATALVSGTAGMCKAIGRGDFDGWELKDFITKGADRGSGDYPLLNSAASVLLALKDSKMVTSFSPLTLKGSQFELPDGSLALLRGDEGFPSGTHHEFALLNTIDWDTKQRNFGKLMVRHIGLDTFPGDDAAEASFVPADTYIAITFPWGFNDDWVAPAYIELQGVTEIIAEHDDMEPFNVSLTTRAENSESIVPLATLTPQGEFKHMSRGKSEYYYAYGENQRIEMGTAYCFLAEYDVNQSGVVSGQGIQIPLAANPEGANVSFTWPYNITNARLTGNLRFRYPEIIGFGNIFWVDDPERNRIDYHSMEIPECWGDIDINPPEADNLSDSTYCDMELLQDDAEYTAHIEVELANVDCTASMKAQNTPLDANSGEEVMAPDESGYESGYLQTFGLTFSTGDATPACSADAVFHITWVFQAEAEVSHLWWYDLSSEFACQNPVTGVGLFTNRIVQQVSVPLTWDLTAGKFPLNEALDVIANQLPYTKMPDDYYEGGFDEPVLYSDGSPYNTVSDTQAYTQAYATSPLLLDVTRYRKHFTPSFGVDMEPMQWSHGIGPAKRYDDDVSSPKHYEMIMLNKLDRAIP